MPPGRGIAPLARVDSPAARHATGATVPARQCRHVLVRQATSFARKADLAKCPLLSAGAHFRRSISGEGKSQFLCGRSQQGSGCVEPLNLGVVSKLLQSTDQTSAAILVLPLQQPNCMFVLRGQREVRDQQFGSRSTGQGTSPWFFGPEASIYQKNTFPVLDSLGRPAVSLALKLHTSRRADPVFWRLNGELSSG